MPNFYKLTYEPFMTVPKNKSHTVYFDPLVKYYEWPVKNLPYGAPKDALYTQFFEAAEFDSMINRILSDFRYMQKPKTLKQSVDEHIIDNNIQITLKNLFKPNNLFYINNKPYTIIDSHWKDMDWQIDKKPIEKLLVQFSNLSTKELEEQAKKEEDDIPEVLRQGNISSSNLTSEENASAVATGLQKKVDISTSNSIVNESEITGETDSFINQDKLPGVSEDMKRLYSEYLRKNNPVNYSDNTDLARDPLTLSLLIDPSQLLNFINLNKKSTIVELYSAHINAKINLHNADKEYLNACTELAIYKTTFDSQVTDITKIVKLNKMDDAEKIKKNSIIQEITLLKINYMKIIFRIADAIMAIYTQQHSYFVATKLLLEGLKNDYINIIKYYEKPELAIKCIEYDISVMNSLIAPDPEDIYSKTFFSNYDAFKIFYEKTLYANKDAILTPNINFRDEEYYFNDIIILSIEKQQYEIYNFKMFLFYSYNQFSIWVLLFKSIQIFAKFIGNEATQFLENSETTLATYNKAFPEAQQREFINRIKAYGIRSSYNKKSKAFDWFLVKEDGSKCIEHNQLDTDNSSQQLNQKKPFRLMEDEMHERLYISSVKSQVQAYDAVVIYIYLLEVVCLRQNRTYVAEEKAQVGREIVDVHAARQVGFHKGETVTQRERQLADRVGPGFGNVVTRDGHRVEVAHVVVHEVLCDVAHHLEAELGREDAGVLTLVLFEDVRLHRAAHVLEDKATEVPEKELHENFAESYGIFSGKATQRAKLRFTPEKARWVSAETWHGQQVSSFDKDGNYILEFDYNQDPELVMEIMKHGDGVEVIGPAGLKSKVKAELEKALKKYPS